MLGGTLWKIRPLHNLPLPALEFGATILELVEATSFVLGFDFTMPEPVESTKPRKIYQLLIEQYDACRF